MIIIDGSAGEGGGQILRTSLALSIVTGQAFQIAGIRAGRERPGLLRQHLTAVNAAQAISDADVTGAVIGAQSLTFTPGPVRAGDYHFAVGSAGSATLVFQTVLPALLAADGPSGLVFEGGTHNESAPPFDFLDRAFLPMLRRMGGAVMASLERPGFYPVGGGKFTASVTPGRLERIEVVERGAELSRRAEAIVANLPLEIGRRELDEVAHRLSIGEDSLRLSGRTGAMGPGNIIMVTLDFEQVTEVFSGHGKVGVRAEHVADKAVMNTKRWLASGAAVGPHLADQLLLPMALAGGGRFTTGRPSLHTRTNAEVIRQFVDVDITVAPVAEKLWEVTVRS